MRKKIEIFMWVVVLAGVGTANVAVPIRKLPIGVVAAATSVVRFDPAGLPALSAGTVVYARDKVRFGPNGRLTIKQYNGCVQDVAPGPSVELMRIASVDETAREKEITTGTRAAAKARGDFFYPGIVPVAADPFIVKDTRPSPAALSIVLSAGRESKTFKVSPDAAGCYSDPAMGSWLAERRSRGSSYITVKVEGESAIHAITFIDDDAQEGLAKALQTADARSDDFDRYLERSRILVKAKQYTLAAHELALLLGLCDDPDVRSLLDSLTKQGYWPAH